MIIFLACFTTGASFLLSFLLFFHPFHNNERANKWLSLFVFTSGLSFIDIYLRRNNLENVYISLSAWINALRLLSAPLLYLSILFFVHPARVFKRADLLHSSPFIVYIVTRLVFIWAGKDLQFAELRSINGFSWEGYFLPLQTMFYTVISYKNLIRYQSNIKLISSNITETDLDWLRNFLLILVFDVLLWINEAFFDLAFLVNITPFVYTGSIYFLAYFSIRQKPLFTFQEEELEEISKVFDEVRKEESPKSKRLSNSQLYLLEAQLNTLITKEKVYLENELSLPVLAQKLGISIHDTSFLINKITGDNFYNFINKHRVEEAKKILESTKANELNMLGVAFAAGFNSKTTFNTTFKKIVGMSPTQYAKKHKKG